MKRGWYTPLETAFRASAADFAENPKEGSLRRAIRRQQNDLVDQLRRDEVFAPSTTIFAPQAEMGIDFLIEISLAFAGCRFAGPVTIIGRRGSCPAETFWQKREPGDRRPTNRFGRRWSGSSGD